MPADFKILPQYLTEAGYFCSNNAKTDYNFNPDGRWDDQGNEAHWRNREEDQQFFSVFNYGITHEGPTNRISEADVKSLKERHDPNDAVLPPYYPDTPEMRRIWAHQYDLISVLDQQVEVLLGQLKEDGLYENTIIFYFSDHGFGLPRYKRWLYHTGLHVPLIVRVPEKYRHLMPEKPGSREDQLVNFVDFAPTVLSLAGIDIPDHMVGGAFAGEQKAPDRIYTFGARSRADDIYEISRCVMDNRYIYIRNFFPHQSYVTEAIIFSDMKASYKELWHLKEAGELNQEAAKFWQPKYYEELYDLELDPHELNNLAGNPQYREKVESMQKALYDWMIENRDVGLLNESEMMNRSEGSSPYEMGASEGYPVAEILKAANLVGKPGVTVEDIIPSLQHSDPGVRYWGIVALQALGIKGNEIDAIIGELLQDESPTVAIAAAEMVGQMGYYEKALAIIGDHLKPHHDPWVVLQAAIATRNLKGHAGPMIPLIDEIFPAYRGEVWDRYKDWIYSMFIGFALDQVYLNCGLEIPE
jgi:hypothetical protein